MASAQTDYSFILSLVYPGAEWTLFDSSNFESLDWGTNNTAPKPSYEELMAAFDLAKPQEAMRLLREKRNSLLQESDVYVLPDFPHPDEATKQAWLTYRQQLRDFPENSSPQLTLSLELDETSVTWPIPPH